MVTAAACCCGSLASPMFALAPWGDRYVFYQRGKERYHFLWVKRRRIAFLYNGSEMIFVGILYYTLCQYSSGFRTVNFKSPCEIQF